MKNSSDHQRDSFGNGMIAAGLILVFMSSLVDAQSATAVGSVGIGKWVPAPSLSVARWAHTATLLQNGQVLVAGGAPFGSGTAELYDPISNTWRLTSNMNVKRAGHTATLLPNGLVLVVGGEDGESASTAELFDPASGRWTPTGSLGNSRIGHTATLLHDGRVLVAGGGVIAATASAEVYDPGSGSWMPTGSLFEAITDHRATLLPNGKVLVSGGGPGRLEGGDIYGSPRAQLYDPTTGTWARVGDLEMARSAHAATNLADGGVLVVGGYDYWSLQAAEVFDSATNAWTRSTDLNTSRGYGTATLLPDGNVLVVGGEHLTEADCCVATVIATAELYDVSGRRWLAAGNLLTPRSGHTATLLRDGRLLVAGGLAGSRGFRTTASVELYEPFVPGTITSAYTGSWYDPAQSGQGLFVEVLPDNRFFAGWFTFNPAGTEQSWFVGVGTYSGNTATINAVEQPTGGRWIPNFDPARVTHNAWGRLTFTFTDCNHGKVDFNSTAGYGSGSMNLTRLTQPAGLACP